MTDGPPSYSIVDRPSRPTSLLGGREHQPERILIDASYTLSSGKTSGIERVVNNLRTGLARIAQNLGNRCSTLITLDGNFFEVGEQESRQLAIVARAQADILHSLPAGYRKWIGPIVRATGSKKLAKWFMPERGHLGIFKLPHRIWNKRVLRSTCRQATVIEPGEGDLLVLPDAYWTRMDIWPGVKAARDRGAMIATVVYDLIPLSHPEFVGQRRTDRFREYLTQVANHSDLILTISETVRDEVQRFLPTLELKDDHCREVVAFPLGAEMSEPKGTPRQEILDNFGGQRNENPYLMVAAFDPRKNHKYLLDAFDELWQIDPSRKLCLVGRVGSRCEDIVERIKNHERLGKQLLTYHDLCDAEVQYCYRHSRGVIFPSIVEGFGLPIVESLWQGQRTFVSNTPIHREVGGKNCVYFELDDTSTLVNALLREDAFPLPSNSSHVARPRTWEECTDSFARSCLAAYERHVASEPVILPIARSA